jgi:uncharacterized MnhB-related membrane protein
VSLIEALLFLLVAVIGAAVVFQHRVLKQVFVYSLFGGTLALLFFVLQAPDVALSEIAIGTLAVPLMVFIAIMKTGGSP